MTDGRCRRSFVFVVIPLTHNKISGLTVLRVAGCISSPAAGGEDMGRSIILLFTEFSAGVLNG
ncbi:MAG TPA: hypothetical protein DHV89_01695 [Ruminococcus sp.]|nr:hypothetical protein [Ruminococcus sp.]